MFETVLFRQGYGGQFYFFEKEIKLAAQVGIEPTTK